MRCSTTAVAALGARMEEDATRGGAGVGKVLAGVVQESRLWMRRRKGEHQSEERRL